jgi:hypothetical protein
MEESFYEDVRRGQREVDGALHAFFAFNALLSLNFSFVGGFYGVLDLLACM